MSNILVVDDDPIFAKAARLAFTRAGHEVAVTDSGTEALSAVVREKVDLIVLDLCMPKMDGAIVLEVLRSYQRWRDTPVIIVTANMESEQFERVKALGVEFAFDKTKFDFDDLVDCAERLLRGGKCSGGVVRKKEGATEAHLPLRGNPEDTEGRKD